MDLTGEPDGPPTKSGLSLVDFSGGLVAAIAMLAALHAARRDGVGCDCDLSLFDTAMSMLTYPAGWALNGRFTPTRTHHSAHPSIVPFQAFASKDGWLVIACPKEKFWLRLVDVLERCDCGGDLGNDPRFSNFALRHENASVLLSIMEAALLKRTNDEWLADLRAAGVPCGPVNTVAQALADPQTAARAMVVETEHPRFGTIAQVSSAVRVGNEPTSHHRAPQRNEDLDAILTDLLHYWPDKIRSLHDDGAFGDHEAPVTSTTQPE